MFCFCRFSCFNLTVSVTESVQTLHTCEISHGLTWTRNAAAYSWFQERTENIQNICWNHTLTTFISTRCKCLRGLRDWFRVYVVLQINTYPHKRGEQNTICFILQGHSHLCDTVRNIRVNDMLIFCPTSLKKKKYWHCLFYYYSLEKFYFNKTASLINIIDFTN